MGVQYLNEHLQLNLMDKSFLSLHLLILFVNKHFSHFHLTDWYSFIQILNLFHNSKKNDFDTPLAVRSGTPGNVLSWEENAYISNRINSQLVRSFVRFSSFFYRLVRKKDQFKLFFVFFLCYRKEKKTCV